jgi:hypothetical protein
VSWWSAYRYVGRHRGVYDRLIGDAACFGTLSDIDRRSDLTIEVETWLPPEVKHDYNINVNNVDGFPGWYTANPHLGTDRNSPWTLAGMRF